MPSLTIIFLLIILLITAFASAQDPSDSFYFPHNDLKSSLLYLSNATVSDGILTLDGSSTSAVALYKKPISLVDSSGNSNLSFSSSFIFSSNSTIYGSGSLAFVIRSTLPKTDPSTVSSTSKELGVAFDLLYINEYLLLISIQFFAKLNHSFNLLSDDPALNQSSQQPACSAESHDNPLYENQVSVNYNASTNQFSAAFHACAGNDLQLVSDVSQLDLSNFLTNSMFVGFSAAFGGVYNVSQWNFTTIAVPSPNSSADTGRADVLLRPSPEGSSSSKSRKGYVVGFSMMGLMGIGGLILVVGACWFWRKGCCMNRSRRVNVESSYDASFGTDPAIAMAATDLKSVPDPKHLKKQYTVPPSPMAGAGSAASQVSGTASWLKPATAR